MDATKAVGDDRVEKRNDSIDHRNNTSNAKSAASAERRNTVTSTSRRKQEEHKNELCDKE